MKVLNVEKLNIGDFPKLHFAKPETWRNRAYHARLYKEEICAFDIETTTIPFNNQAVMYVWQFAIGTDWVCIGRTWDQFLKFVKLLKSVSGGNRLLCFVHNLSYEFQFLSGIHHFEDKDVFCMDSREVLRADLECIEFRCSYKLTNLSLDTLTKRYKVEHQKLSGAVFDYKKQRYPWTPLSDYEQSYIINDVIGLIECIHKIMELYHDTVYTLPLTSTGFVRREVKQACRPVRQKIQDIYPDIDVFKLLRAEFRGGNTHANRYYTGYVIDDEPIHSYDISSSYPSVQCNKLYPMQPFKRQVNVHAGKVDRLIDRGYAVLFQVDLFHVKLRNPYIAIPYIPLAKCSVYHDICCDNGRILRAGHIRMVLTDIDWKIIVKQYSFGYEFIQIYISRYGPLPAGIIDCNVEYFKLKTTLKNVDGQELYYAKNKELLNSIYGLTVQNPCKPELLLNDWYWSDDPDSIPDSKKVLYLPDDTLTDEELLLKAKKRAFISYQFGCWTTCLAREALEAGIDLCGDGLIYVDTDSVKFKGDVDFSSYNAAVQAASIKSGIYATDQHGVTHYAGVYEREEDMSAFITQGAKKYAYTDMDGQIHTTVSGVGKRAGAAALEAAGGLAAFQPGFVFHNCDKTQSVYNDKAFGKCFVDGKIIDITRNVIIREQDYTLSRTNEYNLVLEQARKFLYRTMENLKNVRAVDNSS